MMELWKDGEINIPTFQNSIKEWCFYEEKC